MWSTCLLFFQAVLLAGYIYAHWLRWPHRAGSALETPRDSGSFRRARLRSGKFSAGWVHAVLLAGSFVFLLLAPAKLHSPGSAGDPSIQILLLLAATVGPPYFLLASTAPLIQR